MNMNTGPPVPMANLSPNPSGACELNCIVPSTCFSLNPHVDWRPSSAPSTTSACTQVNPSFAPDNTSFFTDTESNVSSDPRYPPEFPRGAIASSSLTPTGYPMDSKSDPVVLSYTPEPSPPAPHPSKDAGGSQVPLLPAAGPAPETDVMAAVNTFTRMDPGQQQTLVSVLNALVRPEPAAPTPPNAAAQSPPPYKS